MKVAIEEIARFLEDGWPTPKEDWYFEDEGRGFVEHLTEEYAPKIAGAVVDDREFYAALSHQGSSEDPTNGDGHDFLKLFRRWRKSQSTAMLSVEAPKELLDAVVRAIREAGGRVVG